MLTLGEFLALPPVVAANPTVIHGAGLEESRVRWVHTSEVSDIGPLLQGGEVLLTTGLGLAGSTSSEQQSYVRDLKSQGITALVIELGRSFPAVPSPLKDECVVANLPLVSLSRVVPFVEICETAHRMIIERELEWHTESRDLSNELHRTMTACQGIAGVLHTLATWGPACLKLIDSNGIQIAASSNCNADHDHDWAEMPVIYRGGARATLLAAGEQLSLLLGEGSRALAVELAHASADRSAGTEGEGFVRDLAADSMHSAEEIRSRAARLRLRPSTSDGLFVALCVQLSSDVAPHRLTSVIQSMVRQSVLSSVHIAMEDRRAHLVGASTGSGADTRSSSLQDLVHRINDELQTTSGMRVTGAAVGPAVADVAELGRSLRVSIEGAKLAAHLGMGPEMLTTGELGTYRLLARINDPDDLWRFVETQLGPLLRHDSKHGDELVRSLEAYYLSAQRKAPCADRLGIRRQTLYSRLERVRRIIGEDVDDAATRTALGLALAAWRLQRAGIMERGSSASLFGRDLIRE